MKISKKHPLILIREKTKEKSSINNQLSIAFENHQSSLKRFIGFCDASYDRIKLASQINAGMNLKEASYLQNKLKCRNPDIKLRASENPCELFVKIKKEYETLQIKVSVDHQELLEQYTNSEKTNRQILKDFFLERPKFLTTTYITNEMIYEKGKQYLEGRFDDHKRSLRKIEMPLLKIATKATTKTSPLWYHNKVSVVSSSLKDFSYTIDKPLTTPNYVFFQRVFEKLIFQEENLPHIHFALSKKMNHGDGFLYVFRNDSDNYKIHRAKDILVKIPLNSFFEKIMGFHSHIINTEFVENNFDMDSKTTFSLIKKMFDLGLIILKTELKEGFYTLENMKQFICEELPESEFNQKLFNHMDLLGKSMEKINLEFSVDNLDGIYHQYDEICDFVQIDRLDKKIMLYGDYVTPKPDHDYDYNEITLSNYMSELLSIFPIFDINQMIKYEFIHQVKKVTHKESILMNHPMLMKILTDVNIQYASFWTNPWKKVETDVPKNIAIQHIKDRFIQWLYSQRDQDEICLEGILGDIKQSIYEADLETEGYYTLFYQKEGPYTIINKTFPGYGSFYQRFLRYTDILKQYGNDINDFYNLHDWRYVEIFETLSFNANVTNQPYFKKRYRDRESRGDFYDSFFEHTYHEENAEIAFENNELFIRYPDGNKIKPVIASSLVRALYPGRLAFISSLFTNISFIPDLAILFYNWSSNPIKKAPRITYKDIILERKGTLIHCSEFEPFNNANELVQYEQYRKFLQETVGERFYYHCRKVSSIAISSLATEFTKPQYCDINNVLHYKLLLNSIKGVTEVLFKEVIPENYSASEYAQEVYVNGRKDISNEIVTQCSVS